MSTGRRLLSNFALCIVLLFTLTVTSEASTAVRNSQVPGEYPHDNNDDNLNSQPQRHQVVDFQSLAPPTPDFIVKEKVLRARKISTRTTIAFAMLLASSSGLLNGACLSGVLSTGIGRAAGSPITSSFTNSALGLASQNPSQLLLGTKCVLSFLGGSALAGIIVPRPVPYVLQNPRNVALALVCGSVFLVAASQNVSTTSTKYLYFREKLMLGTVSLCVSTIFRHSAVTVHSLACCPGLALFINGAWYGLTAESCSKIHFKIHFKVCICAWNQGFSLISPLETPNFR